jgi:hypothetical protein
MTGRRVAGLLAGLIALAAAGCGTGGRGPDYSGVELVEVTGRVTLDGEPLAGAELLFIATDGCWSSGLTDQDGRYRLRYDSNRFGTPPGPKLVRIHARPVMIDAAGEAQEAERLDDSLPRDPLPARYNSQSTLSAEISGPTADLNFALSNMAAER